MEKYISKGIFISYIILFFLLPLIVFPKTSEIFEFNKIVFVYITTVIITSLWLARMLCQRKIIFQKTTLSLPILAFLITNFASTLFSIDRNMSIFGYYSRFNGGILSLISYSILYFAFVSNINKKQTILIIKTVIASTLLVLIYAILQKMGIDKNIWVQDVQTRVFSTFGQPNWLAAFLVITFPIVLALSFKEPKKQKYYIALSLVYFLVILFTKSRSGLIGFLFANTIFWITTYHKKAVKLKSVVTYHILLVAIITTVGTPWTPSIENILQRKSNVQEIKTTTSLETGGTESGEIRKIVWKGAIEIWKSSPILGTGPETFALSYFKFRPKEHNLTSEWNFVYNKAHNEYLNYLANTGIIGFASYVLLILSSLFLIRQKSEKKDIFKSALFSGYVGFLVTNFFGFSVVTTNLLMFLFPAFAQTLQKEIEEENQTTDKRGKPYIYAMILLLSLFFISQIIKYWQADVAYNQGKNLNKNKNYLEAKNKIAEAIKKSPYQPVYYEEISRSSIGMALVAYEQDNTELTSQFASDAINQIETAINLSPNNFFFRKTYSSIIIQISLIDPKYQKDAEKSLISLTELAPNDPKIYYNLGLLYARKGEWEKAEDMLKKSIYLKSNYKEARLAIVAVYKKLNETQKAKDELIYILEKIDPNDTTAKRDLEELK